MEKKSNWALTREGISYSIRLNEGETCIGRHISCTISINSPFSSRQHCKILLDGTNASLVDYSSNGTFINDQQILNDKIILKANDRIGIGVFDATPTDLLSEAFHVYTLKYINYIENDSTILIIDPKMLSELNTNKNKISKTKCRVKLKKENICILNTNIINPYNRIVTRSYMLKQKNKKH